MESSVILATESPGLRTDEPETLSPLELGETSGGRCARAPCVGLGLGGEWRMEHSVNLNSGRNVMVTFGVTSDGKWRNVKFVLGAEAHKRKKSEKRNAAAMERKSFTSIVKMYYYYRTIEPATIRQSTLWGDARPIGRPTTHSSAHTTEDVTAITTSGGTQRWNAKGHRQQMSASLESTTGGATTLF